MLLGNDDTVNGQVTTRGMVRRHAFVGKGMTPRGTDKANDGGRRVRLVVVQTTGALKIVAGMSLSILQGFGRGGFIGRIRRRFNVRAAVEIRGLDGTQRKRWRGHRQCQGGQRAQPAAVDGPGKRRLENGNETATQWRRSRL